MLGFLPVVAVVLLCLSAMPFAQANGNGNGNNGTTTASVQQNTVPAQASPAATLTASAEATKAQKPKPKTTVKPQNKSVLDTEILDSPIGYFKKAFATEEDEADAASNNSAVMITVKALVATLLSTIM